MAAIRLIGKDYDYAAYIDTYGAINRSGVVYRSNGFGVRPVLWVNFSNIDLLNP